MLISNYLINRSMLRNRLNTVIILCTLMLVCSCQWLPEVGSVRLSESSVTLKVGGFRQLTATVEPAAAEYEGITWTSSDPSVATVNNGTISARKVGTTTISATAAGVTSNPCQVTVNATHVTGISLSNYSMEITEGESATLKATVSPSDATDPSFSWGSDNTSVATVQNGKIVAVSPGTANITVNTTDGNKTATCKVTVKSKVIDVTGITLSQSSVSVKEEATVQLKATVKPSNATNQEVSWSSGDDGIATIASDGTVTGVTEGTTIVTAKSADGKVTATCKVTVTAEYVDFPDPNFRKYMVDNFDLNGNGKISLQEALNVKEVRLSSADVKTLQGLEFLENLVTLRISPDGRVITGYNTVNGTYYYELEKPGSIKYINTSKNKKLETLICNGLQLESLDLAENVNLITLECRFNHLTSLDISNSIMLSELDCEFNNISSLDLTNNTSLVSLRCTSNQLTSIDLSRNTSLTILMCGQNGISELNISKLSSLEYLCVSANHLNELDVTKNPALIIIDCTGNRISYLDLRNNAKLSGLSCNNNQLSELDLSNNVKIHDLHCHSNRLTFITFPKNSSLYQVQCYNNQLTTLDLSSITALHNINCQLNKLTTLDVSRNTALTSLYCYSNQLTTLDVSKNKSLSSLDCSPMSTLKTLYLSSGQNIEGVTVNRSTDRVPSATSIKTK